MPTEAMGPRYSRSIRTRFPREMPGSLLPENSNQARLKITRSRAKTQLLPASVGSSCVSQRDRIEICHAGLFPSLFRFLVDSGEVQVDNLEIHELEPLTLWESRSSDGLDGPVVSLRTEHDG